MGAHNCVSGFLNFGITNMSGWIIPCCGGLSEVLQHWGEGEEQNHSWLRTTNLLQEIYLISSDKQ